MFDVCRTGLLSSLPTLPLGKHFIQLFVYNKYSKFVLTARLLVSFTQCIAKDRIIILTAYVTFRPGSEASFVESFVIKCINR